MVDGRARQKSAPSVAYFTIVGDVNLNCHLIVLNSGAERIEQSPGSNIAFRKTIPPYHNCFGFADPMLERLAQTRQVADSTTPQLESGGKDNDPNNL